MESENKSPLKDKKNRKPARKSAPGIILRLILVLLAGIAVGAVVYFTAAGWIPYLQQRVFQPILDNQTRIEQADATQQALVKQVEELSATLEAAQSAENQQIQATLTTIAEDLVQLEATSQSLQSGVEANTFYSATYIPSLLATATAQLASNTRNLSALATAQTKNSLSLQEVELLRIMVLFSRANQYLLHSNFGLAEEQLVDLRDELVELGNSLPESQNELAEELLKLVNGAINDLPGEPLLAAGKLEIIWGLLQSGFQNLSSPVTLTPTPALPTITLTPTPN